MSEHAAFCTEYVHCSTCFEEAKKVLIANEKFLCSTEIPGFPSTAGNICQVPIIAGKIGASSFGGEYFEMLELTGELETTLCHPMRIVLMGEDNNTTIFNVQPRSKN